MAVDSNLFILSVRGRELARKQRAGPRRRGPPDEESGCKMSEAPSILREAMRQMRALIRADRYLVIWRADGSKAFQTIAAMGFASEDIFGSELLSLSVFRRALSSLDPQWTEGEIQEGTLTLQLSGIQSYICYPIQFETGSALLYVDDRKLAGRFTYTDFTNLANLARRLRNPPAPTPVPPAPPARPQAPPALEEQHFRPLSLSQQANLFRCLATFLQSGIPLLHALHALAGQGESPPLRNLCTQLHASLLKGHPLSQAFSQSGRFSPGVLGLLACAEHSGQLTAVLASLSEQLDDSHRRRQRLSQAMIYPCFVLLASALLSILLPAFVLRDHLLGYAQRGPLPWPTQVLVLIGSTARSPWTWAALLLTAALLWRLGNKIPSRRVHRAWHLLLLRNPLTRRFYEAQMEVNLATTLHLQLQAGLPLLRALKGSLSACQSPLVDEQLTRLLSYASQGDNLASVLERTPGVGRSFCVMVAAGEECGHVSRALAWVARAARLEFECALETMEKLFEPFVLVILGIIVGFVSVACLLPTLSLLNS